MDKDLSNTNVVDVVIETLEGLPEFKIVEVYSNFLGNPMFITFILTIVVDVILGNLKAIYNKNFNSTKAVAGSIKHLGIITFCVILLPMLKYFTQSKVLIYILLIYFIFQYVISIIENLSELGVYFPKILTVFIDKFQSEMDKNEYS